MAKNRYRTDPEYRDEVNERARKRSHERFHNDPKFREQKYKASNRYRRKRYHSDPDYRARVLADQKRSRERKKARRKGILREDGQVRVWSDNQRFCQFRFGQKAQQVSGSPA